MSDEQNGTVRYTVKELLAAMNEKLDKLVAAIDTKANAADLDVLSGRVQALERRYWMAVGFLTAVELAVGAYLRLH